MWLIENQPRRFWRGRYPCERLSFSARPAPTRPYRYRKTQPTDEGAVLTCGQYGAILSDELQPSETQQVR
jgi:hypothetical protein